MFHLLTNKAVKLLGVLLITINTFAQNQGQFKDSARLKIELDSVLAKYGLKSKGFVINVISLDQKGGQTAYSINNNYYQNITVTQQPELTEWYRQFFMRHIDQLRRDSAITSKMIFITVGNGSNAGRFVKQLQEYLKSKGYETNTGSSFEPFNGIGVNASLYVDNVTKIVDISIGNLSQ